MIEDTIAKLRAERDALLQAPLPPAPGAALVKETVSRRNFSQVVWRAKTATLTSRRTGKPIRSLYVGTVGSAAHLEALEMLQNRARLNRLNRQIKALERVKNS